MQMGIIPFCCFFWYEGYVYNIFSFAFDRLQWGIRKESRAVYGKSIIIINL
jgi:hypothetical protein